MSRLSSFSPAALRAMFSPDGDDTLAVLLTITGVGITTPIRLTDNYTERLSATDDDVIYGIRSRGNDYVFLPFQIILPSEEADSAPRCQITLNDVTRYLTPTIRLATTALNVSIELILTKTPDVLEISFPGFLMSGIKYNANSIIADLNVESLAVEPFPAHTFTPSYFPGLY